MHKTLHSIQLIRDYMEAKNLIKYPPFGGECGSRCEVSVSALRRQRRAGHET